MRVTLETHVLGKIGEFGQPVMRKRADAMLQDFARQVSERLAGSGQVGLAMPSRYLALLARVPGEWLG